MKECVGVGSDIVSKRRSSAVFAIAVIAGLIGICLLLYWLTASSGRPSLLWWDQPAASAVLGLTVLLLRLTASAIKQLPNPKHNFGLKMLIYQTWDQWVVALTAMVSVANIKSFGTEAGLFLALGMFASFASSIRHIWIHRYDLFTNEQERVQ